MALRVYELPYIDMDEYSKFYFHLSSRLTRLLRYVDYNNNHIPLRRAKTKFKTPYYLNKHELELKPTTRLHNYIEEKLIIFQ